MKVNPDLMQVRHLPNVTREMLHSIHRSHQSAFILFWCIGFALLIALICGFLGLIVR